MVYKRIFLILTVSLLSSCATQRVLVQPTVAANYFQRMAILPFGSGNCALAGDGTEMADAIQTVLAANIPQLQVVERQRIQDIIKEWNLARNGFVDPRTAVQVGKLLGARVIMTGQIKDLSITRAREVMYGSLRVSVRIIEVETGLIRWAQEVKVTHPGAWGRYAAYYDYTGTGEFKADLIALAGQKVAENFYAHEEEQTVTYWNRKGE